nr:hypothetical protein [Tanacetum cinerariifolium]
MTEYIGVRAAAYIFNMIGFIIAIGSRAQICKIRDSFSLSLQAWYLDDGTIIGDTLVVGKEDPRSSLAGVFSPNIARPLHGAKLLCGPASVDFNLALRFALERIVTASGLGFGISNGKEVYIGLGGRCDKPLHPTDMLLYSWDEWLDVCVDFTRSSPLTQTGMVDFVPDQVVIDVAHRKRVKYEAKCEDIVYGFIPASL